MEPSLRTLLSGLNPVRIMGGLDRAINSLCLDSRRVVPGSLFFALPGIRTDGSFFIEEAIDRGAIAIVTEKSRRPQEGVTIIQVDNARKAMAAVSRRYYGCPDETLRLFGVTGTNGKTTVTHLIRYILKEEGEGTGLLGTVNFDLGARSVPSFRTTPESIDIYNMLAQIRDASCRNAVLEVSSHGIEQHRIAGLHFETAVFLNLTQDHLDYHTSMEEYFAVKTRLFTGEIGRLPKVAVINSDDPYGCRLLEKIPEGVGTVTFGEGAGAVIRAEEVELTAEGASMRLVWPDGSARIRSPLIGRYNVSNLLAAIATAYAVGKDLNRVLPKLALFPGVPGRMERIETSQPFNVVVDYAHTDDALRNALVMLRSITPGRLFVVFGCGGNRDRTKRPLMTRAVQELADYAWATADNPRSEDLGQIFADIQKGVFRPRKIRFVEDRRRAISLALDETREGDCVLIAGKGHETFQMIGDTILPFDDRLIARELLQVKQLKST